MSSAEIESPEPRASTPRVGADLRAARERNGWGLAQVAASLRIKPSYLQAIEAGRTEDLPGTTYAVGFLRTYAEALGLDSAEMTRRFKAEVAELNAKTELTFPAPIPDRGVPPAVVVVFGLIIAVGAYIGWYHFADRAPGGREVVPVPAKLARLADPTALLPTHMPPPGSPPGSTPHQTNRAGAAPAAAIANADASEAAAPTASTPAASSGAAGSSAFAALPQEPSSFPSAPSATGAATQGAAPAPAAPSPATANVTAVAEASPTAPAPAAASADTTAEPVPPSESAPSKGVVIRATAETWIEVRDSSGAVIFTKLMRPGETWTAPERPGLVFTTGNAGGTEILVDGKPTPSLGGPGKVERDQPLDPALIKAGALPAQIAAAATH